MGAPTFIINMAIPKKYEDEIIEELRLNLFFQGYGTELYQFRINYNWEIGYWKKYST